MGVPFFLSRVSVLSSLSLTHKGNAKSSLNDFKLQRTGEREIFGKGCLATVTEIKPKGCLRHLCPRAVSLILQVF